MSDGNTILNFPNQHVLACHICQETTDYQLNRACKRCGEAYCMNHASRIDPMFCEHCFLGVVIQEEEFRRTDEHYDEKTDTVRTIKSPIALKQTFTGVDWVFFNNSIKDKTEDELKLQLKFYKAAVSAMEMELTQKVVRKLTGLRMAGGNTSTSTTTTTKTKKTTRVAKPVDLAQLAKMMKDLNLTPEMLTAMFMKREP